MAKTEGRGTCWITGAKNVPVTKVRTLLGTTKTIATRTLKGK